MKNTTQVEIFGSSFTIKSDTDPSYTIELANFVDSKMKEVAEGAPAVSSHKITILASMNIANDLFQIRKEYKDKNLQANEKIKRLIQIIKDSQEKDFS
ncbi:MAG: cell division protein ZapA [Nitrospinae bacterium]|nr:cell division protein ZapA [Nitrospinota bacterium]